jgi:hypothetical protein
MLYIGGALGYCLAQHVLAIARYGVESTWKTRVLTTPGLLLTMGFIFIFLFGALVAGFGTPHSPSESHQLATQLEANFVYTVGLFLAPIALGFTAGEGYLVFTHHFRALAQSTSVFVDRGTDEHIDSERILEEHSIVHSSAERPEKAVTNHKPSSQQSQTQSKSKRMLRPSRTSRN